MRRWHKPSLYDLWFVPIGFLDILSMLAREAEWLKEHGGGFDGQESQGSAARVPQVAHRTIH